MFVYLIQKNLRESGEKADLVGIFLSCHLLLSFLQQ